MTRGADINMGRAKFPDPKQQRDGSVGWDPATTISPHAIVVGSSGTGKTYRLRYIIRQLMQRAAACGDPLTIHILDVHGDIAPNARNRVVFSEATEYGLNPLEIEMDPEFGGIRRRINSFIQMLNRATSKLGARQEGTLRHLLSDLYELNGYDPKNPRTWNPATNPHVKGKSRTTGRHPGIADLVNLCAWRIKFLATGSGSDAFKALAELNKAYKKLAREQRKDTEEDAKLQSLKMQCTSLYTEYVNQIETGRELDDYLNYDSLDTMRSLHDRILSLDAAGIFRDNPPAFNPVDPLRVYDIKALQEAEQTMFAEVLLERLFVEAKAQGPSPRPHTFILLDEAHKFMVEDRDHVLNRMAREIRKFGVGLIIVSQNFDHFPEDLIANSSLTMILGLHDMHHDKAARKLGIDRKKLKFIQPQKTALIQVRSTVSNGGLPNGFNEIYLASGE